MYQSTANESKVVKNVALKLKQPIETIKSVRRLPGKKEQPAKIKVEIKEESLEEKLILAAKSSKIIVADICPLENKNHNNVFIREAMTKHTKTILWQAKQEFKSGQNYEYAYTISNILLMPIAISMGSKTLLFCGDTSNTQFYSNYISITG